MGIFRRVGMCHVIQQSTRAKAKDNILERNASVLDDFAVLI
jgi:hypothetical protein